MFAPKTLILELAYALLILAVLVPKPHQMRALVAAAAGAGIGHAFWVKDRISLIWMALLLAACLVMLGRRFWSNRSVRFTAEEQAMLDRLFTELPRHRARHLIDQGLWLTGKAGDVLTREGEPVDHLYYLAEGGLVELGIVSAYFAAWRCLGATRSKDPERGAGGVSKPGRGGLGARLCSSHDRHT